MITRGQLLVAAIVVAGTGVGAGAGVVIGDGAGAAGERSIVVKARQYAYDPPVIRANRGDTLRIKLVSLDVVHGFFLEGHDVDAEIHPQKSKIKVRRPSEGSNWAEQDEVVVKLDRPGKFRFRCSHTCGTMHPFMNGELVVAPNHLYHAGLGGSAGLLVGFIVVVLRRLRNGGACQH